MNTIAEANTGLKPETVQSIKEVLTRFPEVEKCILYGSRAKGTYRNGSDIDLTLEGPELNLTLLNKIDNELDDLLLPYKIDLSVHHKIESGDLKDHITRVGKVFYEKGNQ